MEVQTNMEIANWTGKTSSMTPTDRTEYWASSGPIEHRATSSAAFVGCSLPELADPCPVGAHTPFSARIIESVRWRHRGRKGEMASAGDAKPAI
jgi:hypothetical protein